MTKGKTCAVPDNCAGQNQLTVCLVYCMMRGMSFARIPLFVLLRSAGAACLLVWVLLCTWAWWWAGSYAECGLGLRLLGFGSWGLGLSLLPIMLLMPPVDRNGRIRWAEPVRMSRILPALAQCLLTAWWLGYDVPRADGAGDIMAVFGLVWAIGVNIGTAVLVWLLSGIDRLFLRGDDV